MYCSALQSRPPPQHVKFRICDLCALFGGSEAIELHIPNEHCGMSTMQQESAARRALRRTHACNECKRRKVRCSGDERCSNCTRDGKLCRYDTPLQRLSVTEKRLQQAERTIRTIERAWAIHLPTLSLQEAIARLESENDPLSPTDTINVPINTVPPSTQTVMSDEQPLESSPAECSNAEDYEFDESQDFDNSTDGMGFLVSEPSKVGYMGPQSGVAALKFLQSLHLSLPVSTDRSSSLDAPEARDLPSASSTDMNRFMDDYFSIYHTAYPILHEGTFRARVSGALAKPRDGSWPILYNIVLAIGAFVGDTSGSNADVPFYKIARKHLSMDVLEKGSLSYVQGIVLMANYLQKRNKPNSGFVLIGIGWSMALAIGLHREFGLPSSSPFTMEIRRRTWWTLFIFVSGAQLTLGRPPASLVGVNVRLPRNLDDQDLAVDMDDLPAPKEGPTVTSCLIEQTKLAKVANTVQVELLTNQIPGNEKATVLDRNIVLWRQELPPHFDEQLQLAEWFEIPKRVLIWRSFHLRIILNRPILFKSITARGSLAVSNGPVHACLTAAEECVDSICGYLESAAHQPRGLAWYATYWLITASFVQATCFAYDPTHNLAPVWKAHLQRAVSCLSNLGTAHSMALRARDILKKLLDQGELLPFFGSSTGPLPTSTPAAAVDFWQLSVPQYQSVEGSQHGMFYGGGDVSFQYHAQGSSDAELLDATGGIMLQNYSEATGQYYENRLWMPA